MKSDDYLKEIEQHRKTIQLEDDAENKSRSRRDYHRTGRKKGNKKPSKRKANALLTTIFGIFILIPVAILIYVSVFYEPKTPETATMDNQLKIEVNAPENNVAAETDQEDESNEDVEEVNDEIEQPEAPKSNNDDTKAAEEVNVPKTEEQDKQSDTPVSEDRTHVVAPGETLFRIAMNYYGTPDGIEKIKSANGLSSNEISAGQTLLIP